MNNNNNDNQCEFDKQTHQPIYQKLLSDCVTFLLTEHNIIYFLYIFMLKQKKTKWKTEVENCCREW